MIDLDFCVIERLAVTDLAMKVANHYKLDHQMAKLAEECNELSRAFARVQQAKERDDIEKLRAAEDNFDEELADCLILEKQIIHLFYLRRADRVQNVRKYVLQKLIREEENIATGGVARK